MAAVYRTLYEKYEQNDVLHVGIQEVVEAEKEIDVFLKSLDRNQRDQLDTLLGRLSRAYEMQGFLFGGLASGAKWNGKTAPEPGDGYGRSVRAYHGSTLAPVCQIDRKTNQVIHEYPSIAAASRATGLDDSAIGKVCKGKLPMRAVSSSGTSSSKSFTGTQKYFKKLSFCSCFPRARVV